MNNVNVIELCVYPLYDESGEYYQSSLVISHDNGQDKKVIKTFNQLAELTEELGSVLAEYVAEYE